MIKNKPANLKTKKAFQGILNLSLNQYRCPNCFGILYVQVYSGVCAFSRYKSSDYWSQMISTFREHTVKLFLNMKISDIETSNYIKRPYSRIRGKIDFDIELKNKKYIIDSAVKPCLICKKCKYSKQLHPFVKKPSSQSIKKTL